MKIYRWNDKSDVDLCCQNNPEKTQTFQRKFFENNHSLLIYLFYTHYVSMISVVEAFSLPTYF